MTSTKKELLVVESAEAKRNWLSEMNILMFLLMQPDLQGGKMRLYILNINIVPNSLDSSLHLCRNHSFFENKSCLCMAASVTVKEGKKCLKRICESRLTWFCVQVLLFAFRYCSEQTFFWQGLMVPRFFSSSPKAMSGHSARASRYRVLLSCTQLCVFRSNKSRG